MCFFNFILFYFFIYFIIFFFFGWGVGVKIVKILQFEIFVNAFLDFGLNYWLVGWLVVLGFTAL